MASGRHPTTTDTYEPEKEVWRSSFLRALVMETEEGSIAQISRLATAHPLATHEFFTTMMTEWMLEDKTYPWYDFVGCTALYIASAYARVNVVRWLLDHGSDPLVECKFPGMDIHSETRTLGAVDVIGQFSKNSPPEDIEAIEAMLKERIVLKAPPMPSMSMKCTWHSWTELVPDKPSLFGVGDKILCGWKGSVETFHAVVKKVEDRIGRHAMQTYTIVYEPPQGGGYYKAMTKKGRNGEPDVEVLFIYKDGKLAPPLVQENIPEENLTLNDGSIPPQEERFKKVCFIELRAKVNLDWSCFWIPSKSYCVGLTHQMRYRILPAGEWTNLTLQVPRATLRGLMLGRKYEVQVRARNGIGWSDLSKPVLTINTPPRRKGASGKYDKSMEKYGFCKDLNSSGAEEATDEDWEWLYAKYGETGPST